MFLNASDDEVETPLPQKQAEKLEEPENTVPNKVEQPIDSSPPSKLGQCSSFGRQLKKPDWLVQNVMVAAIRTPDSK